MNLLLTESYFFFSKNLAILSLESFETLSDRVTFLSSGEMAKAEWGTPTARADEAIKNWRRVFRIVWF